MMALKTAINSLFIVEMKYSSMRQKCKNNKLLKPMWINHIECYAANTNA